MAPFFKAIDQTPDEACDKEPIHFLGAIQPNGFLLSVGADWHVLRASENVADYLAATHSEILGNPVGGYIPAQVLHDIRGSLQTGGSGGIVGRLFGQPLTTDGPLYDVAVHQSGREFVLEFEPSTSKSEGSLSDLRSMIAGVQRQSSSQGLYREAARHIRAFTGYDRVMVYRFDEDGAGEVVAESSKGGLTPFLGLRYPASDIPVQARALYERNYLRAIVDVDATPVRISPTLSPEGLPLDLTMSILRSVSPVHIEYLKNMGVRSSMSISILRGGRLWGLIACHHGTPMNMTFEMRSTAEMFGQVFSYLLDEHQRTGDDEADAVAHGIHDKVAAAFGDTGAIVSNLSEFLATVLQYIPSDGVGVYAGGKIALSGTTPTQDEFLHLVGFLNLTATGTTFSTHKLCQVFPAAAAYVARSAGILSIPISRSPRHYLVFFRREILSAVLWAGEPTKVVAEEAGELRVSPRKSFEAWREIVQGQSARWTKREARAGEILRGTLLEIALQTSDSAHVDRTGAGLRQEILIAELNHRNRNILGLVRGLISQSAASATDVAALVDNLDDRIRSLASANDILTSNDWKPASLLGLLRSEISTYSISDECLVFVGPDVMLQAQAYSAMAMVIHEVVTNARKHGALTGPMGKVIVETAVDVNRDVEIVWRETGGPLVKTPTRRGFGSTILEQAIPFEVSGVSKPSYPQDGFRLDLKLPAAVARCFDAKPGPPACTLREEVNPVDALALSGLLRSTLVVEDNLFIAVDAEDMLKRLGAATIEVAKNVSEALNALADREFSFALLDVNLGVETSLPVALALQAKKVPFVFGTGYGEELSMPVTLKGITIVSKPYGRQAMRAALLDLPQRELAMSTDRENVSSFVPSAQKAKSSTAEALTSAFERGTSFSTIPATGKGSPNTGLAMLDRAAVNERDNLFIRKMERFVSLSIDDEAMLAHFTSLKRSVDAGKDIASLGVAPNGLYVVLEGFACRYKSRSDGSRLITNFLVPGDACDLSSVTDGMTDALGAISKCSIANASRSLVLEAKLAHPAIAQAIQLSSLIDQAIMREWLMNLGRRSAEERLAHLFCELLFRTRDASVDKNDGFWLPLTQFDLGDTVGLSYVHVNRTLQSLRQRGLISLKGRHLNVLDVPGLTSLAEFTPNYLMSAS